MRAERRPLDPAEVSYILEAQILGVTPARVIAERFTKPQRPPEPKVMATSEGLVQRRNPSQVGV